MTQQRRLTVEELQHTENSPPLSPPQPKSSLMDLMDVPEPGASADPWGSGAVSRAAAASEDPWQSYGRNAGGGGVVLSRNAAAPAAFLPRLWGGGVPLSFLRFNECSGPSWLGAGPGLGSTPMAPSHHGNRADRLGSRTPLLPVLSVLKARALSRRPPWTRGGRPPRCPP